MLGTDGWARILERFAKIPVKLTAGPHTILVGFTDRSRVESDDNVGGGGGRGGAQMANLPAQANNAIEIKGPYNPTGITDSKTRPMIFRFFSGSVTPARWPRNLSPAATPLTLSDIWFL